MRSAYVGTVGRDLTSPVKLSDAKKSPEAAGVSDPMRLSSQLSRYDFNISSNTGKDESCSDDSKSLWNTVCRSQS